MEGNEDVAWSPTFNVFVKEEGTSKDALKTLKDHERGISASIIMGQNYEQLLCNIINKLNVILRKNLHEQETQIGEYKASVVMNLAAKSVVALRKPITLFAAPYFRDIRGCIPPDNDDSLMKRKFKEVNAYVLPPKPWSHSEYKNLAKAVYVNAHEIMLAPLLKAQAFNKEKLMTRCLTKLERKEIYKSLDDIERSMEKINKIKGERLWEEVQDSLDWMKIAAVGMSGVRYAEECQYMWFNYLQPDINKKKFTAYEDATLKKLVEERKQRDWEVIAKNLGTGRTALQCLERYQSRLNENILNKFWTHEEDERLCQLVEACRVGNKIPWHKVCYYMNGRSRVQVTNRWSRVKAPGILLGPWTTEEDALLFAAYQRYGHNWAKISELISWRTSYACRERYTLSFSPGVVSGNFKKEEDCKLLELIAKHGEGKWSTVARELPGRIDSMCAQRALCLKRFDTNFYEKITRNTEAFEQNKRALQSKKFPDTKTCDYLNKHRKKVQADAKASYLKVLSKYFDATTLAESAKNGKTLVPSIRILQEMSSELLEKGEYMKNLRASKPTYRIVEFNRRKRANDRRKRRKYDEDDENSFDEDEEEEEDFDEELLEPDGDGTSEKDDEESDEEHMFEMENEDCATGEGGTVIMSEAQVDKELKDVIAPRSFAYIVPKRSRNRTQKEFTEYEVIKSELFKACGVSHNEDEDGDLPMNYTYRGHDYSESWPRMKEMFVMPICEEGQLPTFPPCNTNVTSFVTFMAIRKLSNFSLSRLNEVATHNISAISSDFPSEDRTCHACVSGATVAQGPEGDSNNQPMKECQCELIKAKRSAHVRLRERFISSHFWPSVLSFTKMTPKQLKAVMPRKRSTNSQGEIEVKRENVSPDEPVPKKRKRRRRRR